MAEQVVMVDHAVAGPSPGHHPLTRAGIRTSQMTPELLQEHRSSWGSLGAVVRGQLSQLQDDAVILVHAAIPAPRWQRCQLSLPHTIPLVCTAILVHLHAPRRHIKEETKADRGQGRHGATHTHDHLHKGIAHKGIAHSHSQPTTMPRRASPTEHSERVRAGAGRARPTQLRLWAQRSGINTRYLEIMPQDTHVDNARPPRVTVDMCVRYEGASTLSVTNSSSRVVSGMHHTNECDEHH